jgi:hypothetical protein
MPAIAQTGAPPSAPLPAPKVEISITPYAWAPALSGSLSSPLPRIGDRSFDISSGGVLGDLATVPVMATGEVRMDRFALVGDIFFAGLEQDVSTRDVGFQGGHTRVTATVGTVLGMFRLLDQPGQALDFGPGIRIWDISTKISLNPGLLPGVIQRASATWVDPLFALRYSAALTPRFGVSVYGDIGGFDTGSRLAWQAMGSVDYQVSAGTTLRAGWRYLTFDKSRGNNSFDLGFNGPFIAATFRF